MTRASLFLLALLLFARSPGDLFAQGPFVEALVNWASLLPAPALSPGTQTVIFGTNLSTTHAFAPSVPLPTTLAGYTVRVNGTLAPLIGVTPTHFIIQVPWELPEQAQAAVVISGPTATSSEFRIPVRSFVPGIFNSRGAGPFHGANFTPITASNPARAGEFLTIFGVGWGPVNNQPPTGGPAIGDRSTTRNPVTVRIGESAATVTYSGLAPSFAGLYQANLRVPSLPPSGAEVPLVLTVGGVSSNTINIAVESAPPTMLLSQNGLPFSAVAGEGSLTSQSVAVLNVGQGVMNWTAEVVDPARTPWLSVTPARGATRAGTFPIPSVAIAANAAGLAVGSVTGRIRLTSPEAVNSPQGITVVLNVVPAGTRLGPVVQPSGLIFAAQAGTSSPAARNVTLSSTSTGPVTATANSTTLEGGGWLNATPQTTTILPGGSQTIAIQPTLGSLSPGVYRGLVTLTFGDGSPQQAVNVVFTVTSQPVTASARSEHLVASDRQPIQDQANGCTPKRLVAVSAGARGNFSSAVAWPILLEVQVADDCGAAVPNANVVASFSNGDAPLVLNRLGNGIYTGTWVPVLPAAPATAIIRAALALLTPAEVRIQVTINDNPSVPAVFPGGVVNGASFAPGQSVAPGSIVAIFGRRLSSARAEFREVPLPTQLSGTTVSIAGIDVPLFFASDGQVNAQLPFELPPSGRQQLLVKTGQGAGATGFLALPETVTIVPAAPGIFTMDDTGRGAVINATTGQVVTQSAPVRRGDYISIFGTGLGALQVPVTTGAFPPATLARTVETPVVTIADLPAEVQFSGLAPGLVGLYQVNAIVPAGVPSGVQSLKLTIRGATSNLVTVAIE